MKNSFILDDVSNTIHRAYFTFKDTEFDIEVLETVKEEFIKTYPELPETQVFKDIYKGEQNKIDTCLFVHKFFSMLATNRSITKTPIENQLLIFDSGSWRHKWIMENPEDPFTKFVTFDVSYQLLGEDENLYLYHNGIIYQINEKQEIEKDYGEGAIEGSNIVLKTGEKIPLKIELGESEYKAGRDTSYHDNISVVYKCVEGVVKHIEQHCVKHQIMYKSKTFEADDIIGYLSKDILEQNPTSDVFMFSNDVDMDQNATNGNVKMREIKEMEKGHVYKLNPITKRLNEMYGLKSLLIKIIVGDSSDNIPNILPKLVFNGEDMDKRVLGEPTVLKQFDPKEHYTQEDFDNVKEHVINFFVDKYTNKIIKKRKDFYKNHTPLEKINSYSYYFDEFYTILEKNKTILTTEEEGKLSKLNTQWKNYLKLIDSSITLEELEKEEKKINKLIAEKEKIFHKVSFNQFKEQTLKNFERNQKIIDVRALPEELVEFYKQNISPKK